MQSTCVRALVLAAVLLLGAGLYAAVGRRENARPRWPESDTVYLAQGWVASAESVSNGTDTTALITREFRSPSGARATLTEVVSRAPKVYGPGPEVPFLGTGYAVEGVPATAGSAIGASDVGTLVANRGDERWLVMYAYGEDRGLLGNGPVAWALALADGILGRPDDYYKLYLAARTDGLGPEVDDEVAALARELFPRVAAWYASP